VTIEGVEYHRYRVRFRLANGRRVCWRRWAPYPGALWDSLVRELDQIDLWPGNRVFMALDRR